MKVCGKSGCPELTTGAYCSTHTPEQPHRWHTSTRSDPKGWDATRRRVLRSARFQCYRCGGRATVADHTLPMAWGGSPSGGFNLRAMCGRCHKAKTRHEAETGKVIKNLSGAERMKHITAFLEEWI